MTEQELVFEILVKEAMVRALVQEEPLEKEGIFRTAIGAAMGARKAGKGQRLRGALRGGAGVILGGAAGGNLGALVRSGKAYRAAREGRWPRWDELEPMLMPSRVGRLIGDIAGYKLMTRGLGKKRTLLERAKEKLKALRKKYLRRK